MFFVIQGSSRNWSGSPDLCINKLGEKTAIQLTIENILSVFADSKIVVCAPEYDKVGLFENITDEKVRNAITYGQMNLLSQSILNFLVNF